MRSIFIIIIFFKCCRARVASGKQKKGKAKTKSKKGQAQAKIAKAEDPKSQANALLEMHAAASATKSSKTKASSPALVTNAAFNDQNVCSQLFDTSPSVENDKICEKAQH